MSHVPHAKWTWYACLLAVLLSGLLPVCVYAASSPGPGPNRLDELEHAVRRSPPSFICGTGYNASRQSHGVCDPGARPRLSHYSCRRRTPPAHSSDHQRVLCTAAALAAMRRARASSPRTAFLTPSRKLQFGKEENPAKSHQPVTLHLPSAWPVSASESVRGVSETFKRCPIGSTRTPPRMPARRQAR